VSEDRPPRATGERRLLPKGRLEAFSDGVFAIVITLLVLELEVPRAGVGLWRELVHAWPAFLGYIVSFAFIGGSWVAHSNMTRFLAAADLELMGLNLLLLLFVSFLPFTTNLMATHLADPGQHLAVILFGANLTLAAMLLSALVRYAARAEGLAVDDLARAQLQAFEKERRASLALLLAASLLAVFLPVAAVVVFLLTSVLLLVQPLWRTRRVRAGSHGGG
jgi:uncharacterized membrane protein